MHLLIATPYYPPYISGAGRYLADFAESAVADGHAVTVLQLGGVDGNATTINGVTVRSVASHRHGMTSVAALRTALNLHRQQPFDLVVAGLAHPTGVVVAIISRLTKAPMLAISHSEELARAETSALARRNLRFTFHRCRRIIAISSWTRRNVIRFGGRPEVCSIIHPALDAGVYESGSTSQHRERARVHLGLEDRRVVLTVARLEARKGHDVVAQAVAQLAPDFPNVHYLVVGQGNQQALLQLCVELDVADRLTILSDLPSNELIDTYAAADLFAMTSRPGDIGQMEGFGIVYLEAAACGLPCVAGNVGGCADAVVDGSTGLLVDPTDVHQVAAALRKLLANPTYARELGAAGQARVERDFSLDAFHAATREVLRDIDGTSTALA
ncbi:MAG: glycosyl transferase [Ilumatobacteraceae bacterium]|nr:glycosyl transferase [Ilumatobacteraceae bacterium]